LAGPARPTEPQLQGERDGASIASIARSVKARADCGAEDKRMEEFWHIALAKDGGIRESSDDDDSSSSIHDDDIPNKNGGNDLDPVAVTTRARSYRLPLTTAPFPNGVTLRLVGLSTGIASPLGAQAWYGSALLSAALIDPRSDDLREALADARAALELGSGAVGLCGLALACVLAKHQHRRLSPGVPSRLFLTDHDEQVLRQLQANVTRAARQLTQEYPDAMLADVSVCRLDWNDVAAIPPDAHDADIRLVVGSELVYTAHNAKACAEMILALLDANPRALVVIVQVTDREGWSAAFLPTLLESNHVIVKTEPIDPSWHELASSMIPLGGTTDRFDFGVCCISRATKQSAVP
jgi:Lysine methyltransferase